MAALIVHGPSASGRTARWSRTGRPHRAGQADHDADRHHQHRLAHHHADHTGALRAERHADADLVGAPRHAVGHQAEQADARQQQRQRAEQRVEGEANSRSCAKRRSDRLRGDRWSSARRDRPAASRCDRLRHRRDRRRCGPAPTAGASRARRTGSSAAPRRARLVLAVADDADDLDSASSRADADALAEGSRRQCSSPPSRLMMRRGRVGGVLRGELAPVMTAESPSCRKTPANVTMSRCRSSSGPSSRLLVDAGDAGAAREQRRAVKTDARRQRLERR